MPVREARVKDVVRCCECSCAAHVPPVGFMPGEGTLFCTDSDRPVEPDDGCTFGVRGQQRHGRHPYDVCIGNDAAKFGYTLADS